MITEVITLTLQQLIESCVLIITGSNFHDVFRSG